MPAPHYSARLCELRTAHPSFGRAARKDSLVSLVALAATGLDLDVHQFIVLGGDIDGFPGSFEYWLLSMKSSRPKMALELMFRNCLDIAPNALRSAELQTLAWTVRQLTWTFARDFG